MIFFESHQNESSSDSLKNKQKEQKISTTLNFLTFKNIVFPKILNYLFFSETKGTITIRKTDSLLKLLMKTYNVDLIEKFSIDIPEYTEQELIIRILQLCIEKISILTEEILISTTFFNFYYKLYDYQIKEQNNNEILQYVQQIIYQTPNIQIITEDYKYFIFFKAQMIAIVQSLKLKIPLTSLLLCTRFYMNRDTQQFFVEFQITKQVYKQIYNKRQMSRFNYSIKIDQLINLNTLSLSEMNYYIEKVFPKYEDELIESNFNIFSKNLNLILEQKKYMIVELKQLVQSKKFKKLYSNLQKFRNQVDQAEKFYEGLSQIVQYQKTAEKSIMDFSIVNIPSFIKKDFFRTHEKRELSQQQQIESLLLFNKIMTEMIKVRFPFPKIIAYLDLNIQNQNLIMISKELIIECQEDCVFNLFIALIHYNFQTQAKSQTYSKAFYYQQLGKQEYQQKEIIFKMLEIILDYKNLIKNEIEKIINEEDTKCKIQNYITKFQNKNNDQNIQDKNIAQILLELIQFNQTKLSDGNKEKQLKNQLQNIISDIEYKTKKQPYQERRLGRPPGYYQQQQYFQRRTRSSFQQQQFIEQSNQQQQLQKEKKKNKLSSQQKLMEELESFLV
ncbi:unnamed protein product [Paramecium sonneborni]|uniref:Uncharacterized protein n=1 Tax=Paramecium sonneborni TaxID=65129 RepID=A0A8S1QUC2_9CILI|nr:unnamed protein product [Paramecium sonneborni]